MPKRTDLTLEQEREIVKIYTIQKIDIKDVARQFHIGNIKASNLLKKYGVKIIAFQERKVLPQTEKEMIDLYLNKELNLTQIAKNLNLSIETISQYLKHNNIIGKLKVAKYDIDESYFEKIDTHEKAYWLGILLTDGYLKEGRDNSIALHIQERDIRLLENFKECLKLNMPIRYRSNGIGKNGRIKKAVILEFGSKKMAKDLKYFSMKQAKSLTVEFPKIDNTFFFSFLCGVFMGDGWFSLNKDKRGYIKFTIAICSASKSFVKGILETSKKLGYLLNWRTYFSDFGTQMYQIYTGNRTYAVKFLDKVFENIGENLYLKRKYDVYQKAKQSLIDNPPKSLNWTTKIPKFYKELI